MHTIVTDKQRRVRLPDAEPGQVWAYEIGPNGIHLSPVRKSEPRTMRAKLVRKNGRLYFEVPKGFTPAPGPIPRDLPE